MIDAVLDELRQIREALAVPSVEPQWLDAKGVGKLISQEPSYVLQRLAIRPDFPEANRVGQPRWDRDEVLQWMADTRARKNKPGRKRAA